MRRIAAAKLQSGICTWAAVRCHPCGHAIQGMSAVLSSCGWGSEGYGPEVGTRMRMVQLLVAGWC